MVEFANVTESRNDNLDWAVVVASGNVGDKTQKFIYVKHAITLFEGNMSNATLSFAPGRTKLFTFGCRPMLRWRVFNECEWRGLISS